MAYPYMNVAKRAALASGQFGDASDAAGWETVFTSAIATGLAGTDVPLTALRMAVLASARRIATRIGMSEHEQWRAALRGVTSALASGAYIPFVSSLGYEFVGNFGNIRDSVDLLICTERSSKEIDRLNRLFTAGVLQVRPYHFHKAVDVIFHTRALVIFEGCVWDEATQIAAYNALGNCPLPQGFENFHVADTIMNLVAEGFLLTEAGHYANIVAQGEQMIDSGIEPIVELPDTTAKAAPDKE